MTATATATEQAPDAPLEPGRGLGRYLAIPAFCVAALLVLYLWVSSLTLDSIEARRLTADFITASVLRHLYLVGVSTVIVILLAVPLGVALTRPWARRVAPAFVTIANTGQAIPSVGVVILLALLFGFGVRYAIVALVVYAFLPVLRNTMVGLQGIDPTLIEAGRGMGMSRRRVLARIELPLAVPVVLAGVRTALVINVGTAAIAAITNGGGLGDIIYTGLVQSRDVVTLTGAVLTAVLALLVDYAAGLAEDGLRPSGL